jgi:hypothetical protein
VPLPAEGTVAADPVGAVRAVMLASYDVLVTHADLMPHFLARQGARGGRAVRLGEATLDALERAGITGQQGRDALRVLVVHTIGFAAFSAEDGVLPAAEVRATYERALDWLLAGITSR